MNNKIRVSPSRKAFIIFNTAFFTIVFFLCFYPIWYIFIQSLSDSQLAMKAIFWPIGFTFDNYKQMLQLKDITHAALISVLRTVIGTGLTVCTSMVLGYVFSKQEMPCRKLLYRTLVVTMYVSGGLIPTYLVYKAYGMLNSFWVYIIPSALNAYYVILAKTYVEQLPISVEESAMIDGANVFTIIVKIVFPMAIPIAAALAIYASVGQWNAWFDNQIYTVVNKDLTTLQFLLYNYLNQAEQLQEEMSGEGGSFAAMITPRGIRMTVTMITVIPILFVYPFMQRYLIKGLTIGAVKG